MSRKKQTYKPDYYASRNENNDTFGMLFATMAKDSAYIALSPSAKYIYVLCRIQAREKQARACLYMHSNENGKQYNENCFVFPAKQQQEYGIKDHANFSRYMRELINGGFVEIVEQNQYRHKPNVYRFSDVWKNG